MHEKNNNMSNAPVHVKGIKYTSGAWWTYTENTSRGFYWNFTDMYVENEGMTKTTSVAR